ncbi:MAG: nitroreductase family protein [Kiritimatiellae bacterium]|nr:nitroreductase family protein [Kiritimatiellia bacterium]
MKYASFLSVLAAGTALAAGGAESGAPLVVACVGDSITYGHGASDRGSKSYPAQLQALLGEGWDVRNFGHNARTALDEGKEWNGQGGMGYRKSPEFAKAKDAKPDVVLFMLGTNDSKPVNWGEDGAGVKRDYAKLVDDFLALAPAPVVVVGVSPFVKKDSFSIREKIVGGDLGPWQRAFAAERGLPLVDAYEATKAAAETSYIGDGVHPNDAGYGVIAAAFASKLRELEPALRERRAAAAPAKIVLPAPKRAAMPLGEALAKRATHRAFSAEPLSDQELSDLLWAANGYNRPEEKKRTAPTAINRQEVDLYVCRADGAFLYDAAENALVRVCKDDLRGLTGRPGPNNFALAAPVALVYTIDFERQGMQGRPADSTKYACVDCGFVGQNVYLHCAATGLNTVFLGSLKPTEIAAALGLPETRVPLFAQTVGKPAAE